MDFPLDALRRWPDLEGLDLPATDAADRLILDESATARAALGPGELVVVGDAYGALTLASAADGATAIRVHQDPLTGEQALAANAAALGLTGRFASEALGPEVAAGARVVLLRLPRSLDALRDIAGLVAAHGAPDVVVFAGGRIKHMTVAMNDVLRGHFDRLDVTHARQKSRVLVARGPHDGRDPEPARTTVGSLVVCAYGGAFAGASVDIGTRFLLEHLPAPPAGEAIDLACGTGVVAASLATRHPSLRVYACDQSAVAVASARATVAANGVADRVEVARDDMLRSRRDASASFIALNPPFHVGASVNEGIAPRLFEDAARVLRPGGELWTVWNSALRYRAALERIVGPTRQVARNSKFTVTVSVRR
ncbi:methyltransferase [Microbacterium sp. BK668]|uniref:class I SAM-dependent methyltransferase n=1 Tax=Microbacterium sp. BK668 TaxID=2512118 RepID=UPI00105E4E7D|nr:methyltransferase [Microbacterium sp. BK668]TDN92302.1 16S rRNA (guanine1207-N2)-methyltransferase [Microbacterium sp. BK668]